MSKSTELLRFATPQGEEVCFPVATVQGDAPGPNFVITAGLHGAEYPGIAAAVAVFKQLDPAQVHGKVTIVTISSLKAFESRSMFVCPVDGKNPNRFFPGDPQGTYTDVMVNLLFEKVIKGNDYHLDLHGGDMVEALEPFSIYHQNQDEKTTAVSREMAYYYGLPNLVSTQTAGTWADKGANYANSAEHNIPAVIAEVGSIGQLEQDAVDTHVKGVLNVLRYAGVLNGPAVKAEGITEYRNFVWLYTPVKGIFYCDIQVGDLLEQGQIVGRMEDYFGNLLLELKAPVDGKVLFLTTSPAMKENGLIMGIGEK